MRVPQVPILSPQVHESTLMLINKKLQINLNLKVNIYVCFLGFW